MVAGSVPNRRFCCVCKSLIAANATELVGSGRARAEATKESRKKKITFFLFLFFRSTKKNLTSTLLSIGGVGDESGLSSWVQGLLHSQRFVNTIKGS